MQLLSVFHGFSNIYQLTFRSGELLCEFGWDQRQISIAIFAIPSKVLNKAQQKHKEASIHAQGVWLLFDAVRQYM